VEGATELSEFVEAYYDYHCKRRTRPLFADIVIAFRDELQSYQQVFVIIDALDESQASVDLVSTVLDLQRTGQFNLWRLPGPYLRYPHSLWMWRLCQFVRLIKTSRHTLKRISGDCPVL
jgi:hypothetical protein